MCITITTIKNLISRKTSVNKVTIYINNKALFVFLVELIETFSIKKY